MDVENIWRFELRQGAGSDPATGACVMDAVSWIEYGKLGDHPGCVCPVLANFARGMNDILEHEPRQRLRAYIPRFVGTRDAISIKPRAIFLVRRALCLLSLSHFAGRSESVYRAVPYSIAEAFIQMGQIGDAPLPAVIGHAVRIGPHLGKVLSTKIAKIQEAIATGHYRTAATHATNLIRITLRSVVDDQGVFLFETLDGLLDIGLKAETLPASKFADANHSFQAAATLIS